MLSIQFSFQFSFSSFNSFELDSLCVRKLNVKCYLYKCSAVCLMFLLTLIFNYQYHNGLQRNLMKKFLF